MNLKIENIFILLNKSWNTPPPPENSTTKPVQIFYYRRHPN